MSDNEITMKGFHPTTFGYQSPQSQSTQSSMRGKKFGTRRMAKLISESMTPEQRQQLNSGVDDIDVDCDDEKHDDEGQSKKEEKVKFEEDQQMTTSSDDELKLDSNNQPGSAQETAQNRKKDDEEKNENQEEYLDSDDPRHLPKRFKREWN